MGRLSKFLCASTVAMLALGVGAVSYPKEGTPSVVAVKGAAGGLRVNDAEYHIKGVAYSPVPVGETANAGPLGDYFTPDYAYIWARDLPAIAEAGFNTIRIYGWNNAVDHSLFLDAVHQFGLKAILTFYVSPLKLDAPFTKTEQDAVIAEYTKSVELYGDHPAILVWAFGNELNGDWHNIVQKFDVDTSQELPACGWQTSAPGGASCYNTNPDAAVDSPCFIASNCMYKKFFGWLDAAVLAAKEFTSRPQTSTFADVDYFMTSKPATDRLARFASNNSTRDFLPNMDILTVQIYRGDSFEEYFNDYRAQTDKPLLIGEYGADAYNDPCGWAGAPQPCANRLGDGKGGSEVSNFVGCSTGGACALPGVTAQANFDKALTEEMIKEGQVVGGILMEWHDENWKNVGTQDRCDDDKQCKIPDGSTVEQAGAIIDTCDADAAFDFPGGSAGCSYKAHISCSNYNAFYHDLCGYPLPGAPDGYVNEAWFGLNGAEDCGTDYKDQTYADADNGHRLTTLKPRPALLAVSGKPSLSAAKTCAEMATCYNCVRNAWGTIENARNHIAPGIAKGDCNTACGFTFKGTNTDGGNTGGSSGDNNDGGDTANPGDINNDGAAGVVRASLALVASLALAALLF